MNFEDIVNECLFEAQFQPFAAQTTNTGIVTTPVTSTGRTTTPATSATPPPIPPSAKATPPPTPNTITQPKPPTSSVTYSGYEYLARSLKVSAIDINKYETARLQAATIPTDHTKYSRVGATDYFQRIVKTQLITKIEAKQMLLLDYVLLCHVPVPSTKNPLTEAPFSMTKYPYPANKQAAQYIASVLYDLAQASGVENYSPRHPKLQQMWGHYIGQWSQEDKATKQVRGITNFLSAFNVKR